MKNLLVPWRNSLRKGWRRTAFINTIAVAIFTLLAAILLGCSISRSGGGINSSLVFFDGDCAKSRSVNLWLHLLLNAFSTGVLASSNFFMQVVNSPTRSEIDKAHREQTALEIGVPSLSNIFHVAWFKGVCWALFFASSFPLHLFFNSVLFSTEYQGSSFHLTIASDAFVDGAQYFGPGAVLWRAGAPQWIADTVPWDNGVSYGSVVNVTDYFDASTDVSKAIEFAAESSRGWKRLEVPECLSQYVFCGAHNDVRDVVWVVKSHNSSGDFMIPGNNSLGWRRADLLAPMSDADAAFWAEPSPLEGNNSLWFAANCSTSIHFNDQAHTAGGCYQSCNGATGNINTTFDSRPAESIPSNYTFDFFPKLDSYTAADLYPLHWPGLSDPSAATLDLEYCLAQEVSSTCKVVLSNKLLLVVLVCLVIKTTLCIVVLFIMPREDPLVVPGDAIVSFICSPDECTTGKCTMDREKESKASMYGAYAALTAAPAQWHAVPHRRWTSGITRWVWTRSYLLFAADIIFVGAMFGAAQKSNPVNSANQTLSQSATNGILNTTGYVAGQLLSSVLTANVPQLLLSLSYFVYNALYTRLCTEKEWSSYGTDYRPLRVTQPEGQQLSTYRLQLPYRYSIPLIVVSIFLHWLVSNALYVFVLEGGYYWVDLELTFGAVPSGAGTGLSDNAFVGIGYSSIALLAIFLAVVVLAVIPISLARRTIKGPMPLGGNSSMVISAACHVPVRAVMATTESHRRVSKTARAQQQPASAAVSENDQDACRSCDPREHPGSGIEMEQLLASSDATSSDNRAHEVDEPSSETAVDPEGYLRDVSRKPVRWGAVETPPSWNRQYTDQGAVVGHLSFGTREHGVQEPVDCEWYA